MLKEMSVNGPIGLIAGALSHAGHESVAVRMLKLLNFLQLG